MKSLPFALERLVCGRRSGLILLLCAFAPLTAWRLHLEQSLWIDETYSLMMASFSVHQLIATTGLDAHPPGYYLALKAWLKVARMAGFEPGVLWARMLNGFVWVGLALVAWISGRNLLGRRAGTLLAWAVAGGACASLVARDLRGYGVATTCLFGAYVLLVAVTVESEREPPVQRRLWILWGGYALCATCALWTHLLSALVLAAVGLVWLALVLFRRRLHRESLIPAFAGQMLPIVLFSPWLVHLKAQLDYMSRSDPQWMTPPTLQNLGWVFTFWFPLGRLGIPGSMGNRSLVALGLATLVVPGVIGAFLALTSPSKARHLADDERKVLQPGVAAILGLVGSGLFVVFIWSIDRMDLAHTFHGPRYPVLAVHLWAAGLVSALAWGAARRMVRLRWIVLAFVPWMVASVVGQVRMAEAESWGLFSELKAEAGGAWPAPGDVVYVMPSELGPFYRHLLREFDVRRVEQLPCDAVRGSSVNVLDVNSWKSLDRPRDHLIRAVLGREGLASDMERIAYPPEEQALVLYRVNGISDNTFSEICRDGLDSPLRQSMEGSVSKALPEDQLSPTSWSYLEVSPALELYRWSTAPRAMVRFDRAIPAGNYDLHVVGYRADRPDSSNSVGFELASIGQEWTESLPAGRFHVCFRVPLRGRGLRPELALEHPVWKAGGGRTLGVLFYGAWMVPEPEDGDPGDEGCSRLPEP